MNMLCDMAKEIKVAVGINFANQQTLKGGDYPGLSRPNIISRFIS